MTTKKLNALQIINSIAPDKLLIIHDGNIYKHKDLTQEDIEEFSKLTCEKYEFMTCGSSELGDYDTKVTHYRVDVPSPHRCEIWA